jgi:hypothetical protein
MRAGPRTTSRDGRLSTPSGTRPARRPPKRRGLLRYCVGALVLVAVFGAGLALGEALHDNPAAGDTQTLVRTLKPLEVPPAPETVTVTVSR